MRGRRRPRVALLSNGEEEGKGDERVRETARGLKGFLPGFVGNVEPKDVYGARADVVVADGFVGNVAIKMAEATADFLFRNLREEIPKTLSGKVGGALIRPRVQELRARVDWRGDGGGRPLCAVRRAPGPAWRWPIQASASPRKATFASGWPWAPGSALSTT